MCYSGTPSPDLCGAAEIAFQVVPTPLVAMLSGGNTIVGTGNITIDALRSSDPDGEPGTLEFAWACAPAPPASGPCLTASGSPLVLDGVSAPSVSLALLGSSTDPRGKNYTITVTVTKGDRSSSASVWLSVLANRALPTVTIVGVTAAKVNPSEKLTLLAAVTSPAPPTLSTAWSVASPPELTDLLARPGVAATALSSQSLVLNPNSLPPRTTVTLRLTAKDQGGSATADVVIPVSGAPTGSAGRAAGDCAVSPTSGKGMQTTFNVSADGWTDTDLPLTYAFAYEVASVAGAPRVAIQDFRPLPAASFLLPAGDPAGNYTIMVYCLVQNAFGATAVSAPSVVTVRWDEALLADPAKQAALVDEQSAAASAQARVRVSACPPYG